MDRRSGNRYTTLTDNYTPRPMIVCSCRVFTDKDFLGTLSSEQPHCPRSAVEAYRCLGCGPECGRCLRMVKRILDTARANADCGVCAQPCLLRDGATHTHAPRPVPVFLEAAE